MANKGPLMLEGDRQQPETIIFSASQQKGTYVTIIDNLSLNQFDRVVWGLHNSGKSVPQIAQDLGVDKHTVHDTIVDIWRMDKEFVRKSVAVAKAKEFNDQQERDNRVDDKQEFSIIEF